MKLFKRIGIAIFALVLTLTVATGCTISSTAPDLIGLHYKGGSFSAQTFSNCQAPGTRDTDGPGDPHYYYPVGQRTFSFTGRPGSESGPITIKTKDSQEMSVLGFVTFELNTDCATLRKFHESIGIKYGAYYTEDGKSAGWDNFLNDYLAVPLNAVMNRAGLQSGWRTLYTDPNAIDDFESFVASNLPAEVDKAIGTKGLLTIRQVNIQTPQPSEALRKSLEEIESAKAENDAQKQRNEVARTQYQSLADCRKAGLSEESCVIIKLANDGKIPFLPVGPGGLIQAAPKQ